MYKIIIINGLPGSGKDAFVNIVKQLIPDKSVINISSVDYIKNVLRNQFNISDFKVPAVRNIIANINELSDVNFNHTLKSIRFHIENEDRDVLVFLHMREPHKIKLVKSIFENVVTLYIERNIDIDKNIVNSSDLNTDKYKYDYYINNNAGINNLKDEAELFINKLV